MAEVNVSIVVPSLRGDIFLKPLLDSLLNQSNKVSFEVIICNDSDHSFDLSFWEDKMDLKQIILKEHHGPSYGRNKGVEAARGTLIAFLDDDVYVDPSWLEEGYSSFENNTLVALAGKTIIPNIKKPSAFRHGMQNTGEGYPTCNFWVRRDVFLSIGGFSLDYFDPKTRIFHHEDSDLAYRLMKYGQVVYAENVLAFHPEHGFSWLMPFRKAKKSLFDLRLWQKYPMEYKELTTHYGIPFARVIIRLLVVLLGLLSIFIWFLSKPLSLCFLACSFLLVLPSFFRYRLEKPVIFTGFWLPFVEWLACYIFIYYFIKGFCFIDKGANR